VPPSPPLLQRRGNALDIARFPWPCPFSDQKPDFQACRKSSRGLQQPHYSKLSSSESSRFTWSGWRHLDPRRRRRYGNATHRRDHAPLAAAHGIQARLIITTRRHPLQLPLPRTPPIRKHQAIGGSPSRPAQPGDRVVISAFKCERGQRRPAPEIRSTMPFTSSHTQLKGTNH